MFQESREQIPLLQGLWRVGGFWERNWITGYPCFLRTKMSPQLWAPTFFLPDQPAGLRLPPTAWRNRFPQDFPVLWLLLTDCCVLFCLPVDKDSKFPRGAEPLGRPVPHSCNVKRFSGQVPSHATLGGTSGVQVCLSLRDPSRRSSRHGRLSESPQRKAIYLTGTLFDLCGTNLRQPFTGATVLLRSFRCSVNPQLLAGAIFI